MVIKPLENENRQQAFREQMQAQKENKTSGGIWHESYQPEGKQPMKHLRPKESEKPKKKQMQEIFRTRNTYGEISLGMNEKGETELVAERERYPNGPTVERTSKELEEERTYQWRGFTGNRELNVKKPVESAYGLHSTHMFDKENRHRGQTLVRQSQMFAKQTMQHTALSMLPEKQLKVGETKEISTQQKKLEHQLELAMRMAEEKIVKRRADDKNPYPMLYIKEEEGDGEEDRGEDGLF